MHIYIYTYLFTYLDVYFYISRCIFIYLYVYINIDMSVCMICVAVSFFTVLCILLQDGQDNVSVPGTGISQPSGQAASSAC